jgi:hypothetical protein
MSEFDLKFEIDIDALASQIKDLKEEFKAELTKGIGGVAAMTHAKLLELAGNEMHSLAQKYKDAVSFQQLDDTLWIVSLDASALWIEEGRKSGFQEELLHGKSSKVSKDGTRYAVIPFEHSKIPSQQTSSAKQLTDQIKSELKKRNISYKKIEYGADGSPRLGLVHKFDIESARPARISGITKASHPALSGVSIYQRKAPGGKIRRDIMTFRVISEKSKADGKWMHPGMVGYKLMDKSLDWAFDLWEREILPDIMKKFN